MRALLRVLAYPLLTGGAVAFALLAHRALAARPWFPADLRVAAITVAVVLSACVLAGLLEHVIPYSAAWSRPRGDHRADVWHFLLSNRALDVGTLLAVTLLTPLGVALFARAGVTPWPHAWPVAAQAVLALAVLELPSYWVHRLEHTHPLLWRIHAVHHSAGRMYWWNFSRQHPLDNALTAFASVGLLSLFGVSELPLVLASAFAGAHGMLQHSNADLRTGPLDILLATPRVHRWHHSRVPVESMANYGGVLTVWDHVFRTRRFPTDEAPPEDVGLYPGSAALPDDYLGQMKAPFVHRYWAA